MKTKLAALMLLLLSSTQTSPAFATGWQAPITTIAGNGQGSADNQFSSPTGVVIDPDGVMYVSDNSNHRIRRVIFDESNVASYSNIVGDGSTGAGANKLNNPRNLVLDDDGSLFITDLYNNRIQRVTFDEDGNPELAVTVAGGYGQGGGLNQLDHPIGLARDEQGSLYIADTGNHRVLKVAFDDEGNPFPALTIAGGNGIGSNTNQLSGPTGVDIGPDGSLYVADRYNHRIQKITFSSTGVPYPAITIAGGNGQGGGLNQLAGPHDVVVDTDGSVYIADRYNYRVQKVTFDANGNPYPAITVAGGSGEGSGDDQLAGPQSLALGSDGALYIVDTANHRVQKVAFDTIAPFVGFVDPGIIRVGSPAMINFGCDDKGGSEVSTCTATLDGEPFESGYYLDAPSAGTRTVVLSASDNAGNSTTETFEFIVHGERELTGTYARVEGVDGAIARLYMATFAREPESEGFSFWTNSTTTGPSPSPDQQSATRAAVQAVANYFATSPEFRARYGDTGDAEFVDLMYTNVMVRQADPVGHAFWLEQLDDGMTQAQMLLWFSDSPEFRLITGSD